MADWPEDFLPRKKTMELTGQQLIPLNQQETWAALNDTEILKACVPGCESLEKLAENEYQLVMTAKIGPVSAKFTGKMTLTEVSPPNSYVVSFEGQGGVAGFARGQASVSLAPGDNGTVLSYTAKAIIGGKLAQVGARLIDGVALKLANQFFSDFNKRVCGPA
ncbi:MAG: carbon monoxide dehydrogenase subunit G [Gallionellaceae bacterium]|nr:carbon monoxide dehydrogenase subunit G [Gallionellaceae bacterium]